MRITEQEALRMAGSEASLRRLKAAAERVSRNVCDVRAWVTQAEADELDACKNACHCTWDAINGCWVTLDHDS